MPHLCGRASIHEPTRKSTMTTTADTREPVWWMYRWRLLFIAGLGVVSAVVLGCLPPLPQAQEYHHFADDRTVLGVPNGLNVLSNLPFLIVGVWGLWSVARSRGSLFVDRVERWPWLGFFAGVGLTAFGSAYYHLHPDNDRLMWDRLPMSVAFLSLVAAVLAERIDSKLGTRLLLPLIGAGVASVLTWHWSEQQGRGDLRPYYFVQFYPMLALPLLLLGLPPRYTKTSDFLLALGWYVVAKLCEHPGDAPIYQVGHVVSGHTLKHTAAAAGASWILRAIHRRR
jgi:hypothetical protein